jgi:hypothetical protein
VQANSSLVGLGTSGIHLLEEQQSSSSRLSRDFWVSVAPGFLLLLAILEGSVTLGLALWGFVLHLLFVAPINLFLSLLHEHAPFFLAAEHPRRPAGSERLEFDVCADILVLFVVLFLLLYHFYFNYVLIKLN